MKKIKYFLILISFLAIAILAYAQQKVETNLQSAEIEETKITLYKGPGCQCCSKWAAYMENNGFSVEEIETERLAAIKQEKGIPKNLAACHTALAEKYIIEGHVPAEAVKKMLKEQPEAKGIAVPGMPAGSPGMDHGPKTDMIEVIMFDDQGNHSVYSRH